MIPRTPPRRGFAMVLVLVFVTLILGSWGIAARHVGSTLRIERARATRAGRDATKLALARALASLEAGYPPTSPYVCSIPGEAKPFAVTFFRDQEKQREWTVTVVPDEGDGLPPLDESLFGEVPPGPGA